MFIKHQKNKKGMTLTEILIVISVIAFLAIAITVFLRSQTLKGYDARRKAEVKRIGIAAEEYEKDKNCYPLTTLMSCDPGNGMRPYLDKIPCDPTTGASYLYEHEDSSCPKWYRIYVKLDNESDPDYVDNLGPGGAFSFVQSSANAPAISAGTPEGGSGDGGGAIPETDFYGCFSGVCTLITWDTSRPGPVCDPNFQNSTCYGQCANLANECEVWNE